jgi:hypothetical protein
MSSAFSRACRRAACELESSESTRGRVESLLLPMLHTGASSMDTMASKLGLSRQTILQAEGGGPELREGSWMSCAKQFALRYFSGKKFSVNETVHLVGLVRPGRLFSRLQAVDRL